MVLFYSPFFVYFEKGSQERKSSEELFPSEEMLPHCSTSSALKEIKHCTRRAAEECLGHSFLGRPGPGPQHLRVQSRFCPPSPFLVNPG